jgi:alanine racemase
MSELQKRTWAEISLDNIEHNFRAVKAAIPEGCRYLGVVKADAYGHGAHTGGPPTGKERGGLSGRILSR